MLSSLRDLLGKRVNEGSIKFLVDRRSLEEGLCLMGPCGAGRELGARAAFSW